MLTDTKEFASTSAFFEAKYQKKADPWRFSTDAYELQRYAALLGALQPKRYRHAYEPGCSIGVFTQQLAGICDRVEAVDFSPTASMQAQARCASLSHVTVRCAAVPEEIPPVGNDLLVLSEIGYYFDPDVWAGIVSGLVAKMPTGATVLAAHWLGDSKDHRLTGDQVQEIIVAEPQLRVQRSERTAHLRLDLLVRV